MVFMDTWLIASLATPGIRYYAGLPQDQRESHGRLAKTGADLAVGKVHEERSSAHLVSGPCLSPPKPIWS